MKALIITKDKFPNGNAGAVRQEQLANILKDCGYSVDLIGMGNTTNYDYKMYNSIQYKSLRGSNQSILNRIIDRLLFTNRVLREIKNKDYDVILISSVSKKIINWLKKYKEKNSKTVLIHDSVEWYSASEFKLGKFNPEYIEKNLLNTKWIDNNFHVISISKYLNDYYMAKGIKSIRIPFIIDNTHVQKEKNIDKKNDTIHFIYAGMIGRKDHLKPFFKALSFLTKDELSRINVDIYGCNYNYLVKTNNIDSQLYKKIADCVNIHGRVKREVVEDSLLNANFSLLFRNSEERYAKAGFPTKIVESLSNYTPILCNISSDLDMYLIDGYNSIISKSENVEDILKCLKRILSLNDDDLKILKENSRITSEKWFDYHKYIPEFKKLLEDEQ